MSNITQNIKSYKVVYPQIYSYVLPELKPNEGSQKIGYTEQENVHDRIFQQVKTAAFRLNYELLWSAPAFFKDSKESFVDKLFHKFLEKKGIERKWELGQEWFYFNGEPLKSKDLFDLFRKEKFSALQNDNGKVDYTLRFEQEEAVKKAIEYFEKTEKGEFLWNAKPRFGKTLASYDLAKKLNAKKVLIVTNRPAIANSWFDDFEMFVDGYSFISETSSLKTRATLTREQHIAIKPIKPLITFLSLQDLKGSKYFGGNYEKLRWVADLEWDLLIIDEAHEGVDTGRTDAAFDVIKRKHTLHLSGTPFKALANEKFPKEAIYNWTYLDEQKIKQIEIEEGEIGEHTDLPDLKLFTYRISQMITDEVNQGIEIESETRDYAFDLNEFFRAKDKKFVPNDDLRKIASHFADSPSTNLPSIIFGGRSDLKFNDEFIKAYPNSVADRLRQIQIKHPEVTDLGPNEEHELKSSTLEVLPYVFINDIPSNPKEYYRILGLVNGKRAWRWIEKKYMQPRYPNDNNIENWKVFIPESNGSGSFGEALSTPAIGEPSDSSTPTFISIGNFNTEVEAKNASNYIKTKLVRCLLGILKITQHNPKSNWSYVPLQDFTEKSDIDWSKSISEIDQQLYAKYGLNDDEIDFIERMIKPMG